MKSEFAVFGHLLPERQPALEIFNVRSQVSADPLEVRTGTTTIDALLIPVRYLDTDEHSDDYDQQLDRKIREISVVKALDDSANNQFNFP